MEHRSPALSSFDPTRSPACGLLPSVASRGVSPQDQQIDTSVAGGRTENWVRFVIFEGGGKHAAMRIEVGPSSWVINGCMLLHCDSLLNRTPYHVFICAFTFYGHGAAPNPGFSAPDQRVIIAWAGFPWQKHVQNTWETRGQQEPNTSQTPAKHLAIRSCPGKQSGLDPASVLQPQRQGARRARHGRAKFDLCGARGASPACRAHRVCVPLRAPRPVR
jgi:hypothetical protein